MPGAGTRSHNPLAGAASSSRGLKLDFDAVVEIPDSSDSSQQGVASSPASTADSQDPLNPPAKDAVVFTCLWKDCSQEVSDPTLFHKHLEDHAYAAISDAGPCQWQGCSVTQHERKSRHQSQFMVHHVIQQHMPKKAFRCLILGCNKAFDTGESLSNHINKHPQPKKNEKPFFVIDDPTAKQVREVPVENLGPPESLEKLQSSVRIQNVLHSVGISYIAVLKEYYVTIYGIPEGELKIKGPGIEQRYKLHFPYAPTWIKEVHVKCYVGNPQGANDKLVWRLPLSNPLFSDQLKWFVKTVEKEMNASAN